MTWPAKHISVAISRPADEVYSFASNPLNLPKWAEGLSRSSMRKSGNEWIADSPMGQVRVKFAEKNHFGVIDHDVTLPSGDVVHNPLRVVKNSSGSEVVFTLFRPLQMSDADFERDAAMVQKDLQRLKALLEN